MAHIFLIMDDITWWDHAEKSVWAALFSGQQSAEVEICLM